MTARYGASPLHLLAHLPCCRCARWALLHRRSTRRRAARSCVWLVAARGPARPRPAAAYYGARPARAARGRRRDQLRARPARRCRCCCCSSSRARSRTRARAPTTRVSGQTWDGYAERWLLVSAALFAASGAAVSGAVEELKDAIRVAGDVHAPGRRVDGDGVGLADRRDVASLCGRAPAASSTSSFVAVSVTHRRARTRVEGERRRARRAARAARQPQLRPRLEDQQPVPGRVGDVHGRRRPPATTCVGPTPAGARPRRLRVAAS